ncbi:MAG TPA: sulfite exporter TauE/SafE family protein [Bryobacteraceae bacterium]|nr:sulfite exporter TauE/SafE family protein [Bryobacteraceae bacterium]
MSARDWIFVALGIFTVGWVWVWFQGKGRAPGVPTLFELLLGFVTNFFDTLGIGSFAPTTAIFKFRRMVPDEKIPGTLNVGHSIPTLTEAFLFIAFVNVDVLTLISMMAASMCGAWFGADIVGRWPRRKVQVGMGLALLTAAFFFLMTNLNISLVPEGTALILRGWKLWAGIVGSLALGALMTLGIGLFAPCMILVSLLGMDPKAAFPIMMGSCAFLMPVASARFIRLDSYSPRPALGLALGGLPGVLIAALIVKSLPLTAVRWLVVVAVVYASITMLRSAAGERKQAYGTLRTSTDL